jgi:Stage II sporulation protein E (SpoIIE)
MDNGAANVPMGAVPAKFLDLAAGVNPSALAHLGQCAAEALGAQTGRLYIVDYALRSMRELLSSGAVGPELMLEGSIAGRVFATGLSLPQGLDSPTWWVALSEGTERVAMLELTFHEPVSALSADVDATARLLVLLMVSGRRYTDVVLRARRAQPLNEAAEAQWDLLPPLSFACDEVAISGILEPAYSIGGDSFDYAINPGRLDFAIVDAAGHGLGAVLMSSAAINSLRNSRREQRDLHETYSTADRRISEQFGNSYFVTGQLGSLDLLSGDLWWVNAGHPRPLLVRNDSLVGELACVASMPLGLAGSVREVAHEPLQRGDRVLFYTDGVTESRSSDGAFFGVDRLADYLVRATIDRVSVNETVRRLSANVLGHVGRGLSDDATLLLVEFRGTSVDASPR